MTQTLILFLGELPSSAIGWSILDGHRFLDGGNLNDASELSNLSLLSETVERVVGLVPAEQMIMREMATPPPSAKKFRAAASFILEDAISEPIDRLHYVTDRVASSGFILALRDRIVSEWLDAFNEAGIELDVLTSDAMCLCPSDRITIIADEDRVIVGGGSQAFAGEVDLMESILPSMLDDIDINDLDIFGNAASLPATFAQDYSKNIAPLTQSNRAEIFAKAIGHEPPLNLLNGKYRKKVQWQSHVRPLRNVAALAASLLLVFFGVIAADAFKFGRIENQWAENAQSLHETSFPNANGESPVAHARRILTTGNANVSFLELSVRFAQAVAENDEVQIDRIGFDRAQNRFSVSIRATSDIAIENLRADLAERGVSVRDNGGYRQSRGQRVGELLAELN